MSQHLRNRRDDTHPVSDIKNLLVVFIVQDENTPVRILRAAHGGDHIGAENIKLMRAVGKCHRVGKHDNRHCLFMIFIFRSGHIAPSLCL